MDVKCCLAIFLVLCFFVISYIGYNGTNGILSSVPSLIPNEESINFQMARFNLQRTKSCVLREIMHASEAVWPRLHLIINNCSFVHGTNAKKFIPFSTDKLFLPFNKSPSKSGMCNVVSLGVGAEVVMEQQLKNLYPFCEFYGADPFIQTAQAYSKVGKVYITAVDDVTGQKILNTLNGIRYSWNKVNVTSLGTFLKDVAKINTVHYLSMDIEGSEYRLMPYMASTGQFREESGSATICQISFEFHGPLAYYNRTDNEFEKILINFLSATPFAPIRAYAPGNHHRIFFMNIENDYCMHLFY